MSHPCPAPEIAPAPAATHAPVMTGARHLDSVPVAPPEVEPGTAVVRNTLSLISPGTELAMWTGTHHGIADPDMPWCKFPFRPGYAAIGTVVEVGPGCRLRPGMRVLHHGAHAAWGLARPDRDPCAVLPAGLPDAHAVMARLAAIAATAAWRAAVRPALVLVQGGGLIGNLAAQWYRQRHGCRVVLVDPCPARRTAAFACGIDATVDAADEEAIEDACGGAPDIVVDATGRAALLDAALRRVRHGGEVQLLGAGHSTVTLDPYRRMFAKFVTLSGIHECMLPNLATPGAPISRQELLELSLAAIAGGRLRIAPLLTDRIAPAGLAVMYEAMLAEPARHLGVVIDWEAP